MDDNTTTFVRAKNAVSDQLKNCKDKSHILQNFCNSVYKVREVHMSVANISYLKKCFGYTPLNKIKAMRKEFAKIYQLLLLCFWPHGFNETLCGYIQNQDTYQHKSFNFAEIYRRNTQSIFIWCIQQTCGKCGETLKPTSNGNENLHQMIAKKAPESQHYSGSGSLSSLSFRVAAAIAQKNGERDFIVEVIPNALAITTSK